MGNQESYPGIARRLASRNIEAEAMFSVGSFDDRGAVEEEMVESMQSHGLAPVQQIRSLDSPTLRCLNFPIDQSATFHRCTFRDCHGERPGFLIRHG